MAVVPLRLAGLALLGLVLALTAAHKPVPNTLFGSWYFEFNGAAGNGTMTDAVKYLNYVVLSFVNPANLEDFPAIFLQMMPTLNTSHLLLVSIGGQTWDNNTHPHLLSDTLTIAPAPFSPPLDRRYGIDGIDIDAEGPALTTYPAENLVAFAQAIKTNAPDFLITLDVYGWPGSNTLNTNYMINNHLNGAGPRLIDWIHIMAYAGELDDKTYISYYTDASKSTYLLQHGSTCSPNGAINPGVPMDSVVIGMKAAAGFSSCNPPDYSDMVDYVKTNGMKGVSLWAFANSNGNITLPWFNDTCVSGYSTLCQGLVDNCMY
ncbi:uncharacterized protein MONBRDRAFT_26297 [Monosiga brevicollis MX1]|uniref:GH18 domain-containing protein n=1 Tax=Monosiga brevicollis TaxID=81824 RepID=A9V1Y9_MONBE|nr:uncharacterized protein MONBRDRAFT_26297 [Monosiga brevicollis MX1]EDQ88525.1 predicted protein [Monosiga brevicollis MX1]|eukprot:XP_001746629.1 hypothetical protein [Monosiga brevicollis MX1]